MAGASASGAQQSLAAEAPQDPLPRGHAPRQRQHAPQQRQRRQPASASPLDRGRLRAARAAAPPSLADVIAGFITSAIYTTATYPIHRVKVLLQTQDANPHILSGKVPRYSFAHAFVRLLREHGPAGLWRGNTPYLLRHVPSVGVSFALKDALRDALLPRVAGGGAWAALGANAACGGLAGAASLALVYPFEFATVRMAADMGRAHERQFGHSMGAAWHQVMRREGLLSAYRGFGVAVASMYVYKSLYFGLYDSAKPYVLGPPGTEPPATSPRGLLLRTGLAALTTYAAASFSYPLDIIRKRLIVDTAADAPQYLGSFLRCVGEIRRREGLRGFYRFYWYDMAFRVFGGLVLVGYDVFSELLPRGRPQAHPAAGAARDGGGGCGGGAAARRLPTRPLLLDGAGGPGARPAWRWRRRDGRPPLRRGAGARRREAPAERGPQLLWWRAPAAEAAVQ